MPIIILGSDKWAREECGVIARASLIHRVVQESIREGA